MIIRESISQFVRGGDSKKALRIGARAQIEQWFAQWAPYAEYKIDSDLNIYVPNDSLKLAKSGVRELPNNLKIALNLDLSKSTISKLPHNLNIGGDNQHFSYLDISNTQISYLPEDLNIHGGSLYIENTEIEYLPTKMKKFRDLYLENTRITELPQGLKVYGILDLKNTLITHLPEDLQAVKGVYVEKGKQFKYIPWHLRDKIIYE